MDNNYFFIDGSALLCDIKKIKKPELKGKKFNLTIFARMLASPILGQFHGGSYKRIVFYFVKNDKRIEELITMPDFKKSRIIEDLEIKYCGKRISMYKKAGDWLEKKDAPNYVTDSLYKSEKAVDTQICCDALTLLSLNKLDRLFLYSNDYDFIPLCQTIKTMGGNINLIKLEEPKVNKELVEACDGFFAFDEEELFRIFEFKK